MDFTVRIYKKLLKTLKQQGLSFLSFEEFISKQTYNAIVLRHDVDRLPYNSLEFAKIESGNGIKGTYSFRRVSGGFDEKIIRQIYSLGHEIGYHYEDLSFASAKLKAQGTGHTRSKATQFRDSGKTQGEELEKQVVNIGIESFNQNLEKLRKIVPVKTICMHGSPMSKWDSRILWKYYDYRDFGIAGEPYFDVNFDEVLYLTDTGRSWNGSSVSIRDKGLGIRDKGLGEEGYSEWKVKPMHGSLLNLSPESMDFQNNYKFRLTSEIIGAAESGKLPDRIMMTFHPQRWTDKPVPWVKELLWQKVKNGVKYFVIKIKN
jgi:hypothetical protein